MMNFSRMTDTLAEMAGNALRGNSAEPQSLLDLLQNAGLDPSVLAGLGEGEIRTLLSEHGLDVSQFAPGEISTLWDEGLVALEGLFKENSIEAQNDFA